MMKTENPNPGEKYRLGQQAHMRRAEGINTLGPAPTEEVHTQRIWLGWGIVQWVIAILAIAAFAAMVVFASGPSSIATTGTLALVALVPLVGVTLVLTWIDRWAPLSWGHKVMGLFLGAGLGGGGAIVVNSLLGTDFLLYTGDQNLTQFYSAVFVAPFSEEIFKGLAVVLVMVLARNSLVSPLSGAALGGLVGAGFAYVENILYFVQAHAQGSTVLGLTLFARGVMSPFIHPMATSFTGLMIAWAFICRPKLWGWVWRIFVGLCAAILVHMLWNYLASVGTANWLLLYLIIEMPLLALWLGGLLMWAGKQSKRVARGLESYVVTGWVLASEVRMATNRYAGRYARKWGRRIGPPAPKMVRKFIRTIRRLGMDQEAMAAHGVRPYLVEQDNRLLADVGAIREEFVHLETLRGAAQ